MLAILQGLLKTENQLSRNSCGNQSQNCKWCVDFPSLQCNSV